GGKRAVGVEYWISRASVSADARSFGALGTRRPTGDPRGGVGGADPALSNPNPVGINFHGRAAGGAVHIHDGLLASAPRLATLGVAGFRVGPGDSRKFSVRLVVAGVAVCCSGGKFAARR